MITKQDLPQNVQDAIDAIANDPDVKELVKHVESDSIPTTRHNYGRYMTFITTMCHGSENMGYIIGLALIQAGANRQGVTDALKVHSFQG
jgi:hypothetical protein